MAVKTVGPTGTYPNLSAWWASLPSVFTEVEEALVENADIYEASGTAFTGKTSSALFYAQITGAVASDGRPRAVSGTGTRLRANLGDGNFRVACNHFRVRNCEILNESVTGGAAAVKIISAASGSDIRFENCYLRDNPTGTAYTFSGSITNANVILRNTIVVGSQRSADFRDATSALLENCTFWRHASQIGVLGDTELTTRNCYSGASASGTECWWTGGAAPTGSNNAASDTTATVDYTSGVNSVAGSSVFTSVTSGSEDFRLLSGTNALVDAGATLGSVTTDIGGLSRPQGGAYDIGATERAASTTVTGNLAATEGSDTFAATGTVGSDVTGTLTATEGSDTFAATGTFVVTGTFAASEASDTFSGIGTSVGTLSLGPIIDAQGNLRVSESGCTVYVYSNSTAALVVAKTSQTINGSGYVIVTDPLIVPGTDYRTRIRLADNTDDLPQDTAT